jgi:pimeloyl-ACP methyl ester carboxylesterase
LPVDPGGGWVDLDGPTYFVDHGGPSAGPLLVCVHGLGGSLINWAAISPILTKTCRVLAIDLPGHGRTRALGRPTTVQADQRLLHRFLTEICQGPAVLVGNSMGGMISIRQAAAHPETVAGLVLIDPALPQVRFSKPDPRVAAAFLAFAVPGIGRALLAGRRRHNSPEHAVDAMLRLCCVDPARVPRDVVQASVALTRERLTYPGIESEFLGAARSLMWVLTNHKSYENSMQQVRAPALLLHGEKDRLVSLTSARVVARANPTWRFEIARNVGHVPQLEVPHWTADMILDWLTTAGSGAADGVVLN